MRISTRKVGACRSEVWLEQGVMNEDCISDTIGDRGKRMPRRKHHLDLAIADFEPLAIGEQLVPLRAVGRERVGVIVDFFQSF